MTSEELKEELTNHFQTTAVMPRYYIENDKYGVIDIVLDPDEFDKPTYHIMILPYDFPRPNCLRIEIIGFIDGQQVSDETIFIDPFGNIINN